MKRSIVPLLIVSAILLALMGCSFAELTQQKANEITTPDHQPIPAQKQHRKRWILRCLS